MHQDEGHYSAKHKGNQKPDAAVTDGLKRFVAGGHIGCADAHTAAAAAGVSPAEAGRNLDLMEVRITSCQLGLFGYKGIDKPGYAVPADSDAAVSEIGRYVADGCISCLDLWNAAEKAGCTRMEASAVCEDSGIKIINCQLGAF